MLEGGLRGCGWLLLLLEAHLATAHSTARRAHLKATSQVDLTEAKTLGGIPKILHQSWKDTKLQPRQAVWRASWKEINPDWTTKLWTDKGNRRFVSDNYPWLLELFDRLQGVYQADMVRSFAARYCNTLQKAARQSVILFQSCRTVQPLQDTSCFAALPLKT